MTFRTPIQWCDDSVNPTMGCDGCELRDPHGGDWPEHLRVRHVLFGKARAATDQTSSRGVAAIPKEMAS